MMDAEYPTTPTIATTSVVAPTTNHKVTLDKADTASKAEFRKRANSAVQRNARRIGRDIHRAFMGIGRAAGLEPGECNAALALDSLLYDKQSQDTETPRKVPLTEMGKFFTSKKQTDEDKDAGWQKAQREISHLFVHAYPSVGLAMQMRYKGLNLGDGHMYSSRWMSVATMVAEDFDAERRRILSSDTIKREDKGRAIGEAHERLCSEALCLFDKLDTLIIEKNKPFAVVTGPQAEAFHKLNSELFKGERPKFKTAPYTYAPPPEPDKDAPYTLSALDEIRARMVLAAEKQFWTAIERSDFDTARKFIADAKRDFDDMCARVVKVAGASDSHTQNGTYKEKEELSYTHENEYDGATADAAEDPAPILKNEYDGDRNMTEDSHLQNDDLQIDDLEPNFDDTLEAAISYVRDGWAIVPCCQFDLATGRCTGPESHHADDICKGKVPLIKGKKPIPGAGYTAAARDKGLVTDWFTRQFPAAGVAIRLDGHILIDCDVKNGARGIESYEVLADTFELDATLSAITPSGGRHYIFKLPEDLPADYLGSWTRILDGAELDGIDIKVGVKGLAHVEPSRGVAGVYRWVDPTAEIAELPRACCDYLHEVHELATLPKPTLGASGNVSTFDPDEDQAKYFRDAPNGERRPRLRSIACCLAAGGANESQIVSVLNYHDSRFTEPTNDTRFIARVAQGAVSKFAQGVTQ